MKKKFGIFVGIIIVIFLVIYGIVFYTDYNKVQNGELPVFASKQDNENYKGLCN